MFNIKVNSVNLFLFFIIFIWCLGILAEFLLNLFPSLFYIFPFLKYNYSIVCHTQSEKLFTYFGYHTLVCSRCTGIYFGSLISIILIIFGFEKSISTKQLLIFSIPLFLDVIFTTLNAYPYIHLLSLVTGLLLGSIGFSYIHKLILNLLIKQKG
ncbi:MAG: DUF2085 domain-containing protein [Ignavibacteriae bacterium]|nr:DUF2085 domain-containing protein [Ignavibacteriota bacterium]